MNIQRIWTSGDVCSLASARYNELRTQGYAGTATFTKIALHEMTGGDISGETGYGISTTIQDNEYPIVVIDLPAQKVHLAEESKLQDGRLPDGEIPAIKEWAFKEFMAEKFNK